MLMREGCKAAKARILIEYRTCQICECLTSNPQLFTSQEYSMYKWHVHSAIGRGRPLANDLSRAADGIAASLRAFSVSLSRTAEDGGP